MTVTRFQIRAISLDYLDRIRARRVDDFGNAFVATVNTDEGGTPLRCCLREAAVGEQVALIAYRPALVGGPYAEVGPVFVHAERCEGYRETDNYPAEFRHRQLLLRAYDAQGHQVDNRIVEGEDAEEAIAEVFDRPEVAYLNARNVMAGCFMFEISRARSVECGRGHTSAGPCEPSTPLVGVR